MALRDIIKRDSLDSLDRRQVTLTLKGVEHSFFVRNITGKERCEYERFIYNHENEDGESDSQTAIKAQLVLLAAVDDEGAKVFQPGDYDLVLSLPADALEEIFIEAATACGLIRPRDEDDELETLDGEAPPEKPSKNDVGGHGELS